MEPLKDWFTIDNIKDFAMALVAIRIAVEVTKGMFDSLWQWMTGYKPYTLLYATAWAAFLVYFIKGGDWRVNVFNVVLLVVMSKIMDLDSK